VCPISFVKDVLVRISVHYLSLVYTIVSYGFVYDIPLQRDFRSY